MNAPVELAMRRLQTKIYSISTNTVTHKMVIFQKGAKGKLRGKWYILTHKTKHSKTRPLHF